MEKENVDKEFTDIDKENNNKNYIIVGILYVIVIILSIFLILGIKNQKDIVKDNINNEKKTQESLQNKSNETKEQQNNTKTQDSNNLFDNAQSKVDEFDSRENEKIEDGLNLLDQVR